MEFCTLVLPLSLSLSLSLFSRSVSLSLSFLPLSHPLALPSRPLRAILCCLRSWWCHVVMPWTGSMLQMSLQRLPKVPDFCRAAMCLGADCQPGWLSRRCAYRAAKLFHALRCAENQRSFRPVEKISSIPVACHFGG